jgi:hypothetical protein
MIQVTNNNIREFHYDNVRDDYFYKDNDQRVPDKLRIGFHTTVFKQSSYNPLANHSSNEALELMIQELNIKIS